MKFFKKFGGLFLLILIVGLILFLLKSLVDEIKKNILIENKKETVINSEETFYLVTKVVDGDTLKIQDKNGEITVRLIGVDTPEIKDPRKKVQCFRQEASKRIEELVGNKKVRLENDETQNDKDKYGRWLRYVYLVDGTLINKKIIEEGFGFEYTYQVPYKFQKEFKEAQKSAEEKKMGMWGDGVCF